MCLQASLFQVITCIPTKKLPKRMTLGTVTEEQIQRLDRQEITGTDLAADMMQEAGQILWVRGLTRLQNQVSIFNFNLSLHCFP